MEGGAFLGCLQDGGMTRCCCFLSGFNEAQNDASGGKGKGISWARAVQQALMSCPSFCLDSAPAAPSPAAFLNCIWSDLSNVDSTRWNRSRIPLFVCGPGRLSSLHYQKQSVKYEILTTAKTWLQLWQDGQAVGSGEQPEKEKVWGRWMILEQGGWRRRASWSYRQDDKVMEF